MKKFLLLSLSLFVLSGCSLVGNNQAQHTNDLQTGNAIETGGITIKDTSSVITKNEWYLTGVYSIWSKNYLNIDAIENGQIGPGWAPEIINSNSWISIFEVSNTVKIKIFKYNTEWWQELQNVQREEFNTRGNSDWTSINPDTGNPIYYGCWKTSIIEIEHDTKKIYKITEIYTP
ncbi:MAG: hypothetical protein ACD_80C00041G0010 [uncultured bacterium (gcode 4)]|uniref:Lipoprotein n=1 Tax=uncultured bacterium (gcode 4) TaxID=1234023 RepID=K1XJU6_9BACT|nr:MAG: hypothetical protein ACD_80C00041G0010 [uncultured bacterium (gcode 4)]